MGARFIGSSGAPKLGPQVAFLLAFAAVFEHCVRPFALAPQQAAEPWINQAAAARMLREVDSAIQSVAETKRFLNVGVLLIVAFSTFT